MKLIDADLLGLTDMEIIMCDGDYKEALKMLIDKIDSAPTIEPEPKTGQWLDPGREYDEQAYAKCSECGTVEYMGWWKKFCPICGSLNKAGTDV